MTITLPDLTTVAQWAGFVLGGLGWILALAWRTRRHATAELARRTAPEDWLTRVAAGIATGVSAQGMWRFSGDVLHLDGWLRVLLFAFIEVAVITSAVRAKRSMEDNYSAGVDGIAVWVLACLTAVLSSLDARSIAEAIFRLAAPLVAAWLWERGMAIERRRRTGRGRIHWRLTPERILVRLGLAEPSERSAGEVDAKRRLTRVALAADRTADAVPGSRAARRRLRALKRRGRRMLAHTAVAHDPEQQRYLMGQLGVARAIGGLVQAAPPPFWEQTSVTPVMTPTVTDSEVITDVTMDVTNPDAYRLPWLPVPLAGMTPTVTAVMTPEQVTTEVTKTALMREFWEAEVLEGRYPRPVDLARHADADPALASRLRAAWVDELNGWDKRRATTTTNGRTMPTGSRTTE